MADEQTVLNSVNTEFRMEMRETLKEIKNDISKTRDDVSAIRLDAVRMPELETLRARIRVLEDFKLKTVTIVISVQLLLMLLWNVAGRYTAVMQPR